MTKLPTKHGDFTIKIVDGEHVVLTKEYEGIPLVRIHSECLTGDALGSRRCDCQDQLNKSLDVIGKEGGFLIYLRQEGRGIGLANKIQAYTLQDEGLDTVEANEHLGLPVDAREYGVAVTVLEGLGINEINLLTNNPEKIKFLEDARIVVHRVPLVVHSKEENKTYLDTKKEKLNHLF